VTCKVSQLSFLYSSNSGDWSNRSTCMQVKLKINARQQAIACDGCVQTIKDRTSWMSESSRRLVSYIEPTTWALASTAQTMTVWMTLLVTVDRYVAVCQPWRVADFATHQRRTRLAVLFVLLAAIIYNIPRYFERQVTSTFVKTNNLAKSLGQNVFTRRRSIDLIFLFSG